MDMNIVSKAFQAYSLTDLFFFPQSVRDFFLAVES